MKWGDVEDGSYLDALTNATSEEEQGRTAERSDLNWWQRVVGQCGSDLYE
ncbi:MAG: hypothetical protein Q7S57_02445 [bacterium]|nr:hypothetical protein [bacterium]